MSMRGLGKWVARARRTVMMLALVLGAPLGSLVAQEGPRPPSEVLGITVGADSVLADWTQIGYYMSELARASEFVRLDTIGRSTLGKPMLMVTLTAPRNQARLEEIRRAQARLADPRGLTPELEDSLTRHQPAVVFINNNIHSTEIGSSQFSMILAHRLATEGRYRDLLDRLVVLMTPSANPDGLDTVVAWYRKYQGTPYEGGPLPWLYHPYVGHDNNRDWFMLTQVETRAIAHVLYQQWFPEVVWDVHQMGNRGARMFVPPFSDPVNPNLDPMLVAGTNLVGAAMANAIYDAGRTGVQHQSRFDLWWHGGLRTVPARHNMIGILSETASARLASPIFQEQHELRPATRGVNYPHPWEGGWWRMGDIIEYELLAADGLLRLAGEQREQFVRRFVQLGRRAVARGEAGSPYAYLVPMDQPDPARVAVLANTILAAGVEMFRATAPFEADGRTYPEGTLVIPMAQPFRAHVKDLLERQDYPDRRQYPDGPPLAPYDVAGWTLGLQMAVDVRQVDGRFAFRGEPVREVAVEPGIVHGAGSQRLLTNRANMESRTIADALALGARLWVTPGPVEAGGARLPAGSVVLEYPGDPGRLDSLVAAHVRAYGYEAWATDGLEPGDAVQQGLPRIGLYKPWTASMDEGWTRWVLEQHGIPYMSVTDADIRRGGLGERYDVLVLPDVGDSSIVNGRSHTNVPPEFAGGIGEEGARNVLDFVQAGGVLVALDASSTFAISWLNLPVRNGLASGSGAAWGSRFYAPGSIFGVSLEPGGPLTSGLADSAHVYFARSVVTEAAAPARVVGRYLPAPLRSGYALNQEQLAGKAALVDAPVGAGRAILFGFRPQHRGQTHGTFKLLFNAVLLSTMP
jgi:hypothetical protein